MKRLVLVDGHAILHRAFHALPKTLTTKKGQPVNAVYGFSRMLFKILADLKPDYLVVAFDLPEPTFRHKLAKDYQANRPKTDKDLVPQIDLARKVVKAFGIPIFEKQGFEADDVLGTLSKKACLAGRQAKVDEVVIVTGDRDILQLVDQKTKVYLLKKGLSGVGLVDSQKVKKILGVKPSRVVDYKALVGDASDNYFGVSGIGPKTAKDLLEEFGSLEKIYLNLSKLPPKTAEKLKKDKEQAELSQELAKIRLNVPLKFSLEACRLDFDKGEVRKVFEELRFKSLLRQLKEKDKDQMRLL